MQRLVIVVGLLFVLEASLFASIAPLLVYYSAEFELSKLAAGILTGTYPAGVVVGALALPRLRRLNPRTLTLVGGLSFAVATGLFGLGHEIVLLDVARVAQGIGCAGIWGGGLPWLTKAAPLNQRGRWLGVAMGAATFGTMLGPVIGVVAVDADPAVVFGCIGVVAALLALGVLTVAPPPDNVGSATSILRLMRNRSLTACMVVLDVPFLVGGAISVLVPLRLSSLGGTELEVGATFLIASAGATLVNPLSGHFSDRLGRLLPMQAGLVFGALLLAALCVSSSLFVIVVLTIAFLGCAFALTASPTMALIADLAAGTQYEAAVPAAQLVAIAAGEFVGSTAGASLAQATDDAATYLVLALVSLLGLLVLQRANVDEHDGDPRDKHVIPSEQPGGVSSTP